MCGLVFGVHGSKMKPSGLISNNRSNDTNNFFANFLLKYINFFNNFLLYILHADIRINFMLAYGRVGMLD